MQSITFLDHDHSAYVDQWDWELVITEQQRNLDFLTEVVKKIWKVLRGAEAYVQRLFPQLKTDKYPNMPEELPDLFYDFCQETNGAEAVRNGGRGRYMH